MTASKTVQSNGKSELPSTHPPIVSPEEWSVARQQMLVKEKAHMRAGDALAAERRRMPWMAVEKTYEFEGPHGKASLLDLFEGRRQLIVYRAFFEPGVFGCASSWPTPGIYSSISSFMRKLLPSMMTVSAWCRTRSRMADVNVLSLLKICDQCL